MIVLACFIIAALEAWTLYNLCDGEGPDEFIMHASLEQFLNVRNHAIMFLTSFQLGTTLAVRTW
jgi:hypothetical protein